MVRGSAVRITGLNNSGSVPSPIRFATSKSVATVTINESTESSSNELVSTDDDDKPRLHFVRPEQAVQYKIDVDFLRADPGILSLISGATVVLNDSGDVVGFDSDTRKPSVSFALEVWSKLAGTACADGTRQYGYTVFPFLKGGYLSGFEFKNGMVSFNLRGAQTRKVPRWGVGPFDLEGPHERLIEVVSRNTMFRTSLTTAIPPVEANGIQETTDIIEGGTATVTSADVVDGEFTDTSVWIVEGGRAV
jgi:hypothetical protein